MNTELAALMQRVKSLEAELACIKKEQKKEPQGSLQVIGGRKNLRYYRIENQDCAVNRTYIRQKDISLATSLAKKRYNKVRKAEIESELPYLKHLIQQRKLHKITSQDVLYHQKGYRDLLMPVMDSNRYRAYQWSQEPYIQSDSHPENLLFPTQCGVKVRSKSEVFIVNCLQKYDIPFRYECQLQLGERAFFPDFTIYLAKEDREIIWEHFGMVDNADYRENMDSKMRIYYRNGYLPGHNLICTYETSKIPLTEDMIEKAIRAYLI